MKMALAKEVFDPFAGPIITDNKKRKVHEGAIIDRTLTALEDQVDIDFWHPGDERWFRYATSTLEMFNRGELQMDGNMWWAANLYPKVRFVDASTGAIYEEQVVDKMQVLNNMMPGMVEYVNTKKPQNRKERRKHERDWKRSVKKAWHKLVRFGGKGKEIKY